MNRVYITGHKSEIARYYVNHLSTRSSYDIRSYRMEVITSRCETLRPTTDSPIGVLFCQGHLVGKQSKDQTFSEIDKMMDVNFYSIREACLHTIGNCPRARICIIGSESGYRGSYDDTYALSKRLIHSFIEETPLLTPYQQLVGIAPWIIEDSKMTRDRKDRDNLERLRESHPMGRFLRAREVGKMAYTLLHEQPYINKTVIRMHGGML